MVEHGGLDHDDDLQIVGFMSFERLRNRMSLVDHRVIRDAVDRGLAERLTQRSMTRVLTWALRIPARRPAGGSGRRSRAAEQVGERQSVLGEPLDPLRPRRAAAQRAGEVSPEQVNIIVTGLATVDRSGFDPADIVVADDLLTGFARSFGPTDRPDRGAWWTGSTPTAGWRLTS